MQIHDVRGQLGLEVPQLAAASRRPTGSFVDARGRLVRRPFGTGDCQVERRVLPQDRLLQPSELGPGLDPDLVNEDRARGTKALERLGLPPGAVQREHPQGVKALAQGMFGDQGVEPPD